MAIASIVLFAWSAACWFSACYETPFLGSPLFAVEPASLLLCAAIALAGALLFRLVRSGKEDAERTWRWLRENRVDAIFLLGIFILTMLLHSPAILLFRGANNSDSALNGLAGYHIAEGESRPMFRYGAHYIGTLIPHISAPLHAALGKSPIYQRLITAFFYFGSAVFLYFLAKRIVGRKAAMLAGLLYTIAPFEIMRKMRHTEFAEILFWGSLSLLLLAGLLDRDKPSWRRFFWLGAVLGILFYAHPQGIYLIGVVLIALLLRDWLIFIRPRFYLLPAGFIVGGIVTFVDCFYHDWVVFKVFFLRQIERPSLIDEFLNAVARFHLHLQELLGIKKEFGPDDLLFPLASWLFLIAALLCLVWFVLHFRGRILADISFRDGKAGPTLVLILVLVVIVLFLQGQGNVRQTSVRYIFPLWLAVPIILAAPAALAGGRTVRILGMAVLVCFAASFAWSQLQYDLEIARLDELWRDRIKLLEDSRVSCFYGDFWIAYQTAFITGEEIVGSASYPVWLERIPWYSQSVRQTDKPAAFIFAAVTRGAKEKASHLKNILQALAIDYRETEILGGVMIHSLSERVSPAQLAGLTPNGRADIESWQAQPIRGIAGSADLRLVTLQVTNSGATEWFADGRSGHYELVVFSSDGREIRRQPLLHDVASGQTFPWRLLLDENESGGKATGIQIRVNNIIVNSGKSSLVINPVRQHAGERIAAREHDLVRTYSGREWTAPRDYMLLGGWGSTESDGGARVTWSGSRECELGFVVRNPSDIRLQLRMGPFRSSDPSIPNTIGIAVNGRTLATHWKLDRVRRLDLIVTREQLKPGFNRISIVFERIQPGMVLRNGAARHYFRPKAAALLGMRILRNVGETPPDD